MLGGTVYFAIIFRLRNLFIFKFPVDPSIIVSFDLNMADVELLKSLLGVHPGFPKPVSVVFFICLMTSMLMK